MPVSLSPKELLILNQSPVFKNLNDQEFSHILRAASDSRFSEDQVIIKEEFYSDTIYIVLEGTLRVNLEIDGPGFQVAEVLPGESVGEFCLLDEKNRRCSATVRALSDGRLIRISKASLLEIFQKENSIGYKIMTNLSRLLIKRLEHSNDLTRNLLSGRFTSSI